MAGILLETENITDEERAKHAKSTATAKRAEALRRPQRFSSDEIQRRLAQAAAVGPTVLEDLVVARGAYYSGLVGTHEHLRIIDLQGQQAVDFLCYDRNETQNRYNAANTIKLNRSIYVGKGFRLYSDRADVLMTIVDDTVGFHDTIGGCCSAEANYLRYGIKDTPNCRSNFIAALKPFGMVERDIVANVNFFMFVPVQENGSTEIAEGLSSPGDYVDLVAERDVIVAISNCPQLFNPCNGWNPTPIRLIKWR
jgi:urea carboxylase-associated protein 1